MEGIVQAIANAFGALKEFFGFQSKRLDLKNAADVKAAQVAQEEVDAQDRTKAAIAKEDIAEVRREIAE